MSRFHKSANTLRKRKIPKRQPKTKHNQHNLQTSKQCDSATGKNSNAMVLGRIINYFWPPPAEESLDDAYLTLKPTDTAEVTPETVQEIDDNSCVKKTGSVTAKNGNAYTIDEIYKYSCDAELEVGAKVSYTLYRDGRVQKITNVKRIVEGWDETMFETGDTKKWFHSMKVGEVVKRDGRIIYVQPGDVTVNLNTVESEFVPKVGDWLQVDVKSELDAGVLNYCGNTLEVTKIHPLRTKIINGVVQAYSQITFAGHINRDVYFDRESLFDGYVPRKGDTVLAEVIESNQGVYNWRAVKVVMQKTLNADAVDFELPKLINYEDNVDGIKITDNVYVESSGFREDVYFNIEIVNEMSEVLALHDVKFDSPISQVKLAVPGCLNNPIEIGTGCTETLRFVVNAKTMGESVETLIFVFAAFNIGRSVRICLQSRSNNYKRFNNYNKREGVVASVKNMRRQEGGEIIRGERGNDVRFSNVRIMEYKVPNVLWDMFLKYEDNRDHACVYNELECVKGAVNIGNYERRFHALLYMDEIESIVAMRKYDQDFACFIPNRDFLMLEVENLSEMRPSIIIGDRVIASSMEAQPKKFEGCVHKVTSKHVYLKFAPLMHSVYNGECYSIHAVKSRMQVRKLHHAISAAAKNFGQDFLFPSKVIEREHQCSFTYDKYDDCIVDDKNDNKSSTYGKYDDCAVDDKSSDNCAVGNNVPNTPSPIRVKSNKDIMEAMRNSIPRKRVNNNERDESEAANNDNVPKRNIINNVNVWKLKLTWHDEKLNYYQKEAVRNILLGEARPLPYIIFGPPGTGKTVTVVESIVQILKMVPGARLLVAAPSNSAADILALRLIENAHMKPGQMVRFVSHKYATDELLPAKLLPYSCTGNVGKPGTIDEETVCENGLKLGCSFKTLGRHLVTVGTCGAIGKLHFMGFPKGHFTHVIVDEAGQCTEPEIMVPLTLLDVKHGQAILAGDPMQLGPVIMSKHASEFGLNESFLERMLGRFPYTRDVQGFPKTSGYDPRLVTCLVYNYRSLPGIIKLPNEMFYHSELRPTLGESSKEYEILESVKEILPSRGTSPPSMVFHGLNSSNYQTEDSPSWFNPDEASQVFFYINELYRLGLKSTDIGIISPYIQQVRHIREICREAEFDVPKVGTVEEFQGSEFNVIILSTVRSNKDLISGDVTHSLGFVSNPKRFNVALTRAQALCIIIGNPFLLVNDVHWRTLLSHCILNGFYTGCEFNENLLIKQTS